MSTQHLPLKDDTLRDDKGYGKGRSWLASMKLTFQNRHGRTILADMAFHGPLRVQRPFYPEGEVCHVYLLHPPAGMVSGDYLTYDVNCEEGSHALITTPAANKIYKSDSYDVPQQQHVTLQVGAANLEWFPQETIFFNGANAEFKTRVELAPDARYMGWEILCLGRPACNETFDRGRVLQHIEVWCEQTPLFIEKQHVTGGGAVLLGRYGFAGFPISGTLLACGFSEQPDALMDALRETLDPHHCSVTYRNRVLVGRYLGPSGEAAKEEFAKAWQLIRPALFGRDAHVPRIWLT